MPFEQPENTKHASNESPDTDAKHSDTNPSLVDSGRLQDTLNTVQEIQQRSNNAPLPEAFATPEITNPRELSEKPRFYSMAEIDELWDRQVRENGGKPMTQVKGYYEAPLSEVTNKDGALLSTTESPMILDQDITGTYEDGTTLTIKAGTKLPNGVRFLPTGIVHNEKSGHSNIEKARIEVATANGTITLIDGTVLKNGLSIDKPFEVSKGSLASQRMYIIERDSVDIDTGKWRMDSYKNSDLSRWVPVPGKQGVYSPSPDRMGGTPTEMIQVPKGYQGEFAIDYGGNAPLVEGDWIVKTKDGYYRVSEVDALEIYRANDDATKRATTKSLEKFRERGLEVVTAAPTREEFYEKIELAKRAKEDGVPVAEYEKARKGTEALAKIMERSTLEPSTHTPGEEVHNFGMEANPKEARALAQQAAEGLGAPIRVKWGGSEVLVKPGMTEAEIYSMHVVSAAQTRATEHYFTEAEIPNLEDRVKVQSEYLRSTLGMIPSDTFVDRPRLMQLLRETNPGAYHLVTATQTGVTDDVVPLNISERQNVDKRLLDRANHVSEKYWRSIDDTGTIHMDGETSAKLPTSAESPSYENEPMRLNQQTERNAKPETIAGSDPIIEMDLGRPREPIALNEMKNSLNEISPENVRQLTEHATRQSQSSDPATRTEGKTTLEQIELARRGNTEAAHHVVGKWRGIAGALAGIAGFTTALYFGTTEQNNFEKIGITGH